MNMPRKYIPVESHGTVGLKSQAQMVLWPASDYEAVNKYYQECSAYSEFARIEAEKAKESLKVYLKTRNEKDRLYYLYDRSRFRDYSTKLNKLIDDFERGIYNYKYSDKKNGFKLGGGKVYPATIAINENTLVNPALVIYAKQIANASIEEFRYIASGTGSLPTTPNQNKLQSENSRLDIFINGGFRNPNGDVIREGVIFPPGLEDALITEFGSFTMPTADEGDMQWRNVIDNVAEQIDHDQGNTFYSIAHVTILQINYIND